MMSFFHIKSFHYNLGPYSYMKGLILFESCGDYLIRKIGLFVLKGEYLFPFKTLIIHNIINVVL